VATAYQGDAFQNDAFQLGGLMSTLDQLNATLAEISAKVDKVAADTAYLLAQGGMTPEEQAALDAANATAADVLARLTVLDASVPDVDTQPVPLGAQERGYTNKVIDIVPSVSDIAPVNNADGYALHDVVYYETRPANPSAFFDGTGGLILPMGHGVLTQKQNSTQGALPYLSGAAGFYAEFEASLSDSHQDHWPALWMMPWEHNLAQTDTYPPDQPGYERWVEIDVYEGGFGSATGQLCSVIDWQGAWAATGGYFRDPPANTIPGNSTVNNYSDQGNFDPTQVHRYGVSYSPNEGATGVLRWYRDDVLIFTADAPVIARQQHFYMIAGSQTHGASVPYHMILKRLRAYTI
jgi:hypothetical protein